MRNYIGFHICWQQVFHAFPLCYAGSDVGCRDIDWGDIEEHDLVPSPELCGMGRHCPGSKLFEDLLADRQIGGNGQVREPASRPRKDQKVCQAEKALRHVPVRDIKKSVDAQHEIKAVIRIEAVQFLKGLDSIGLLPGPAFKVKEIKARIVPCCKPDHFIAVTCRGNVFCLEGRITRGDEEYGIKAGKLQGLFCSPQMSEVDRIKCPA